LKDLLFLIEGMRDGGRNCITHIDPAHDRI